MECRALAVRRVCATSRWVRCLRRGRREVKIVEGRIVHSCKERRVIGRKAGSGDVLITALNASRKLVLEQAQKSKALS